MVTPFVTPFGRPIAKIEIHAIWLRPLENRGSQRSEKKILNCILNWKPISSKLDSCHMIKILGKSRITKIWKKILNCILNWKPISSKLYITLNAWKAVLHTSYHFNDDIFDGLTLSDRSSLPIAAPFRSLLPSDCGSRISLNISF